MSIRVTVDELQEQLAELLESAVQHGEECIVQRDGQDYAVIVSAREWERRSKGNQAAASASTEDDEEEARSREIGRRLDALGPEFRLSRNKQNRMETLLAKQDAASLTPEERAELERLVEECDEIMLRRAQALGRVV